MNLLIPKASGESMPEEAAKTIEDELQKLSSLEKNSAEFNTTRNYLDWLVGSAHPLPPILPYSLPYSLPCWTPVLDSRA